MKRTRRNKGQPGGVGVALVLILFFVGGCGVAANVLGLANGLTPTFGLGEVQQAIALPTPLPRAEQPWQPPMQPIAPLPTAEPVPTRAPEPQRNEPVLVAEKVTVPGRGVGYKTSDGRFMSFTVSADGGVTKIGGELVVSMHADGSDPDAPVTVSDSAGNGLFIARVNGGSVSLHAFDGGFFDLD